MNAHDDATVQRLLRRCSQFIELVCQDARLQEADAADVRQEVLLVVWRKRDRARAALSAGRLRSWLRVVTRNKICDRCRTRRPEVTGVGGAAAQRRLEGVPEDDPPGAEAAGLPEEARALFRRAAEVVAAHFSGRVGRIFWRLVLEDARPVDVAVAFSMSPNAVALTKARVLRRLRRELAHATGGSKPRRPA
jgi:DNA-directed RNA polymerase specialized sigma24 family protein